MASELTGLICDNLGLNKNNKLYFSIHSTHLHLVVNEVLGNCSNFLKKQMNQKFRSWWISSSSKKMQLSALERDSPRTKRNIISTTTSTDTSLNLKRNVGWWNRGGGNKLQRGDLKGEWENALFVTTVNVSGLSCGRDHAKVCSEGASGSVKPRTAHPEKHWESVRDSDTGG